MQTVRAAHLSDLNALCTLEAESFSYDQISRRQWKHLLTKAHGTVFVAVDHTHILGYAIILFRKGSTSIRFYSIAVSDAARGKGIGKLLMAAIETAAYPGCRFFAETKVDNSGMQALFKLFGWTPFGMYKDYYEDGTDAIRYEKVFA